jgi:hypothetical protein
VNEFECNCIICRVGKDPMTGGMDPPRRFVDKYNVFRLVRALMDAGIDPVRELL